MLVVFATAMLWLVLSVDMPSIGELRGTLGQVRVWLELPALFVSPCAKEAIAEHDVADVARIGVVEDVCVYEEEDGQVDLLVGEEALLLEAEALDLGKVRRDLESQHRERSAKWDPEQQATE